MTAPDIDIDALRRQLAAAHDLRIDKDDPILVAMVFAQAVVNKIIAEERAKRADKNLLTSTDVREVLMDVRKDSLHYSREIVALALDQFGGAVREDIEAERKSVRVVISRLVTLVAAFVGVAIGSTLF